MGAVALAEDAAAAGDLIRLFLPGECYGLLDAQAHAPDLLKKKFPRSRGAFVARLDGADPAVLADDVNQEGFPAGADDGIQGAVAVLDKRKSRFHGLGLGDGGEIDQLAELPAGYGDPVVLAGRKGRKNFQKGLAGISVMGLERKDGPGNLSPGILMDGNRGQGGRTDAYAETVHTQITSMRHNFWTEVFVFIINSGKGLAVRED